MTRPWFKVSHLVVLAAVGAWMVPAPTGAEDYVIGAEDVLQISAWMHPELERTVAVGSGGGVIYPPVGEIKAVGLTAKQLGERIGDRLSAYLRQSTTVTVTVTVFLKSRGVAWNSFTQLLAVTRDVVNLVVLGRAIG